MPDAPSDRQGVALLDVRHNAPEHERRTHQWLGERIAALLGTPFLGLHREGDARAHYFIPNDTLIGRSTARELGIRSDADFFGGLVAEPFMATKAITHPCPARPPMRRRAGRKASPTSPGAPCSAATAPSTSTTPCRPVSACC